jgi:hypothetical protein
MVAAASVTRGAWMAAAALAAVFIVVLAFHGERPEGGLARFEAAGLLVRWPVAEMSEIDVQVGTDRRSYHRVPGGWRADGADVPTEVHERIELGLKLLHNSRPERIIHPDELADRALADFGLAPPRLSVTVRTSGGRGATVHFGGVNPLGLARYARVEGNDDVVLLSAFVAEAWERVAEAR